MKPNIDISKIEADKLYKIGTIAKLLNLTNQTLRNWDEKQIELTPSIKMNNHRSYLGSDILNYIEKRTASFVTDKLHLFEKVVPQRINVIYARCSSRTQIDDLVNQVFHLEDYCSKNNIIAQTIQEIGSGLNFKRPKFKQLIQMIEQNKIDKLIINYTDRLTRFGYELIEQICLLHHTKIIVLNKQKNKSPEQELTDDLLALLISFSGKLYGRRSHNIHKIHKDVDKCINAIDNTLDKRIQGRSSSIENIRIEG